MPTQQNIKQNMNQSIEQNTEQTIERFDWLGIAALCALLIAAVLNELIA